MKKKLLQLITLLTAIFVLTGCGNSKTADTITSTAANVTTTTAVSTTTVSTTATKTTKNTNTTTAATSIDENKNYYDVNSVILYYNQYKKLPPNYITKAEAEKLGWSGGSVEKYKKDATIGGDRFGNLEKLLPTDKNIKYIECDIDTHGASQRGAKRLIISSDGHYYYTSDHYASFTEYIIKNGIPTKK